MLDAGATPSVIDLKTAQQLGGGGKRGTLDRESILLVQFSSRNTRVCRFSNHNWGGGASGRTDQNP